MDVAAVVSLVELAVFLAAFGLPFALTVRKRAALDPPARLALAVAAAFLTGFGIADGPGIGALALPFGLAATGALAAVDPRALSAGGGALGLALLALMEWGPFHPVVSGIPPPPDLSMLSWVAFVGASVLLFAPWRWSSALAFVALAAFVAVGPLARTYFMIAPALLALAAAIGARARPRPRSLSPRA